MNHKSSILSNLLLSRSVVAGAIALSLSAVAYADTDNSDNSSSNSLSIQSGDNSSNSGDSASKSVSSSNPSSDSSGGSAWTSAYDSSKLTLQTDNSAKVSLLGEDAGFKNTLGFNLDGSTSSDSIKTLFQGSGSDNGNSEGKSVDLGSLAKGTKLNFFLLAGGAENGGKGISLDGSADKDALKAAGLSAVSSTLSSDGKNPYLVLTVTETLSGGETRSAKFEVDLGNGGEKEDGGGEGNGGLVTTPEPSLYMTISAFGAFGVWAKRRSDRSKSQAAK